MMAEDQIAVLQKWHDAINRGDVEAVLALCADDIEVGGPRGSAHGRDVMRDWMARSAIQLAPRRWFAGEGDVVVEQLATWGVTGSDQPHDPVVVASTFQVADGLIGRVVRFETLDAALAMTGLSLRDEV
jgi:ketosteroid isomerase-like protein